MQVENAQPLEVDVVEKTQLKTYPFRAYLFLIAIYIYIITLLFIYITISVLFVRLRSAFTVITPVN